MLDIRRFVVNPFQENCYVVSDSTKEAIVIDCGAFYPEERNAIVKYIEDNRLEPKHLIATHAHIDHNFGNNTMFDAFGLRPEVHGGDALLMERLAEQAEAFCRQRLDYAMPEAGRYLSDSDKICFGTHSLTVLPTPGHTPGSVFLCCMEESIAFSGDTLFKASIGRTDLWEGNYDDIMESLTTIKRQLPPEMTIMPGHGPQTTIGDETRENPFMR